ncbi:hypothetical protein BWI96_12615 [Siphonobacter sp. SORGH_AS_0500]|nr:hypothetical protein BWI96_12615 [Siphonobacter sp. SORGH_AS_0500]
MLAAKSLYICRLILAQFMQNPEDLVLASVGNRFLANLIDNILINILSFLLAYLVGIPLFNLDIQQVNANPEAFYEIYYQFLMIAIPVSFFYRFLQESSRYQATIGKRILKLKVVKVTGQPLSYKDSLFRNVVKEISGYFYMVYVFGLFNRLHQCVHDLAAQTYVVDDL